MSDNEEPDEVSTDNPVKFGLSVSSFTESSLEHEAKPNTATPTKSNLKFCICKIISQRNLSLLYTSKFSRAAMLRKKCIGHTNLHYILTIISFNFMEINFISCENEFKRQFSHFYKTLINK